MTPLHDLIVVELAGTVAGAYCAKMFADQGANVRVIGEGTLTSHQRSYLNQAKTSTTFDAVDFDAVDVVIQSSAPGALEPLNLANEQIVQVHISPLGMTGERSHWKSTDLTDYAMSGHSYLYGDLDREPLRGPPDQPAVAAGLYGFVGAMAGLIARPRIGRGQIVEISHLQVLVALHQVTLLRWQMAGQVLTRMGNRYTGQGQPNGPYQCSDGWVSIVGVTDPQVESLLAVSGLLHLLDHPDINNVMDFQAHPELMDEPLREWLSTQSVAEVVELLQAIRVPACPLLDPLELLQDPQLVAREFFRPLASDPAVMVPGPPFSFSDEQPGSASSWVPGDIADGPLAGLKVLDLARVWAGPLCARTLRQLGAQVVWVEAPWNRGPQEVPQSFIDIVHLFPNDEAGEHPWNRNSHLVKYSLGKQSLALDLQTAEGQEAFAKLVPHFHVLLENFSTRVMPQFGFDETRLHELNPDLVYLTMPGYGRTGPAEHWLAYGSCVDSHAGLSSLIGYADETPWKGGIAWPDPIAGLHAASAVLSVLWSSISSGTGGVTIEAAQFESTVAAIGDRIVEAQVDAPFVPIGNRQREFVAQGVYRCAGDDEWIAISVPDRDALTALCSLNGLDPAMATDHDVFDRAMNTWTVEQDASALAERLQVAGIAAAKVNKAPDLLHDPHLRSVGNWVTFDQPDVGAFTAAVLPIGLSETPALAPTPAPTLGEHNEQILRQAAFTQSEIDTLTANNTIVTRPPS